MLKVHNEVPSVPNGFEGKICVRKDLANTVGEKYASAIVNDICHKTIHF